MLTLDACLNHDVMAANHRLGARLIRVEGQHDVRRIALEDAHLAVGESGAHLGYDVPEAVLVCGDDVHVALDYDSTRLGTNRLLGKV